MPKILKFSVYKQQNTWQRLAPAPTVFTEETVPKLHTWLRCGSDAAAAYFCFDGEKPVPPVPQPDTIPEVVTLTSEQLERVKKSGCSSCGKKRETKLPDTQCWVCAEKHLGTAYSQYTEVGYKYINKIHCIGELVSTAKHIASAAPEFAEKLRTLRHDIQNGLDIPQTTWEALVEEFHTLKEKGE